MPPCSAPCDFHFSLLSGIASGAIQDFVPHHPPSFLPSFLPSLSFIVEMQRESNRKREASHGHVERGGKGERERELRIRKVRP